MAKISRKKLILIGVVVLLVLIAVSWRLFDGQKVLKPKASKIAVEVAKVAQGSITHHVTVVGTLEAPQDVVVSPEISGDIKKILFVPGQQVTAGTPLVQLDDSITKADLDSAKAGLALAKQKYERMKSLIDRGAISQQTFDEASSAYQTQLANVEVAQAKQDKTLIKAPISGTLGAIAVSAGNFVPANTKVTELVNLERLRVNYDLPQKYLAQLKTHLPVYISVNAYPGQKFAGHVSVVSPKVDSQTRGVPVEALIDNTNNQLRPGMYVEVIQDLGKSQDVLLIPQQSLMPAITGDSVYKIIDGDKSIKVPVTVGNSESGMVEVIKGLAQGDVVVTAGQQHLKDGSVVKIVPNVSE